MTNATSHPSVSVLVPNLLRSFIAEWWEGDFPAPSSGPIHSSAVHKSNEAHLERFVDSLAAEFKHAPRTACERESTRERILKAFAVFARGALGFEDRHLNLLLGRGFPQSAVQFTQMARAFDAAVSASDIFQASRNVWTMNGLQVLLGLPVRLTPAMFAYSMLYPYTDNYLDDPAVPTETKVAFNQRFALRLMGENVDPANAQERKICDLVAMIEAQYSRALYPQVYDSLLAIHRAQEKSIRLLRCNASPYEVDVLGISLEKGGTSVLADGYLVAGSLSERHAEFTFGFGAFLQLVDDLQDVEGDGRDGLLTVFSQTARRWPLDAITNRTLQFGRRVLELLPCFDAPEAEPFKELMRRSATLLVVLAAGRAARLHTRDYIRELEGRSPFRFAFLEKQSRRLARQRISLMRMIEAFAVAPAGDATA